MEALVSRLGVLAKTSLCVAGRPHPKVLSVVRMAHNPCQLYTLIIQLDGPILGHLFLALHLDGGTLEIRCKPVGEMTCGG